MVTELRTAEQVLNELEFLSTVEHALIVEYLSVRCALGHDLEAGEGGATTNQGRDAANAAFNLALSEMSHLRRISTFLVKAGRFAQLGRATSIPSGSTEIALSPPTATQLEQLVEREEAIASAVDKQYIRLDRALTSETAFEGDLVGDMRSIVDDSTAHAAAIIALRDLLRDVLPGDYLRATRRNALDALEQRLLDISDRLYALTLAALQQRLAPKSVTGPGLAVSAMESLDEVNRALVQRGLLPAFTVP